MDGIKLDNAVEAAEDLIGRYIYVREADGSLTGGMIIETEAYTADDAASHSFRGKTIRNQVMFSSSGYVYVYLSYGMHWCMNIVTGPIGVGEAVLIRSLLPERNINLMRKRRNIVSDRELTNGPAKLCQALAISGEDNGAKLNQSRFVLHSPKVSSTHKIKATKRIGISKDTHRLWRFILDERS